MPIEHTPLGELHHDRGLTLQGGDIRLETSNQPQLSPQRFPRPWRARALTEVASALRRLAHDPFLLEVRIVYSFGAYGRKYGWPGKPRHTCRPFGNLTFEGHGL